MTVKWVARNEKKVERDLSKALRGNMARAGDVVKESVKDMLGGPAGSAPGMPPGKVTGQLQRSISRRTFGGKNPGFIVIPRTPEMKDVLGRLQKGFVGRDSRGRIYDQRPRPFTGRALDRVKDEVIRKVTNV